jgi:hypothetical protein
MRYVDKNQCFEREFWLSYVVNPNRNDHWLHAECGRTQHSVAKPAAPARAQDTAQLLGKKIRLTHDAEGVVLAEGEGKPAPAAPVQAYVTKAFGEHLEAVRKAMDDLAAQYEPEELNRIGFRLYETFRPEVPSDVKGWGAKGMLDLAKIRDAAT